MKTSIITMCLFSILIIGCKQHTSKKEEEGISRTQTQVQSEFAQSDYVSENSGEQKVVANPPPPPAPPKTKSNINENQSTKEVKLIKDGEIYIQCKNLYISKKSIDKLLKENNGYYSSERLSKTDYEVVYYLEIRIPSSRFEKIVSILEKGKDEITVKKHKFS